MHLYSSIRSKIKESLSDLDFRNSLELGRQLGLLIEVESPYYWKPYSLSKKDSTPLQSLLIIKRALPCLTPSPCRVGNYTLKLPCQQRELGLLSLEIELTYFVPERVSWFLSNSFCPELLWNECWSTPRTNGWPTQVLSFLNSHSRAELLYPRGYGM